LHVSLSQIHPFHLSLFRPRQPGVSSCLSVAIVCCCFACIRHFICLCLRTITYCLLSTYCNRYHRGSHLVDTHDSSRGSQGSLIADTDAPGGYGYGHSNLNNGSNSHNRTASHDGQEAVNDRLLSSSLGASSGGGSSGSGGGGVGRSKLKHTIFLSSHDAIVPVGPVSRYLEVSE
jgi:hypothetical protein